MRIAFLAAVASTLLSCATSTVTFPVKPEIFIDKFRASEGITFSADGTLFIGANRAIWIAEPDGSVRKIADVDLHLGQAGIGAHDILAADFGPKNVFRDGPNDDGIVWRITPAGEKSVVATGIADPNAILVLPDRSFLVSDDGTDKIYRVENGKVSIWSTAVPYPNGMALSRDGRTVFVAQIFSAINPVVPDNRIWAISLGDGSARVVTRSEKAPDGLVADERGRIYIADNGAGKIWRFDPRNGEQILIAEGIPSVASLVFGEGKFDPYSIYATSTQPGGGKIWRIRVGVRGRKLYR